MGQLGPSCDEDPGKDDHDLVDLFPMKIWKMRQLIFIYIHIFSRGENGVK